MRRRQRIILTVEDLKIRRSKTFQLSVPYLQFTPGCLVSVVGANGSGKTTFMEALVGLLPPTSGVVKVSGQESHLEIADVKRALGYIPDDDDWLIPELTAAEYFELLAGVQAAIPNKGLILRRASDLAKELLFDSFDHQLGSLSHGNKKKVQIIAGLMHDPHFVVVDELRNGLDPVAILRAEQILKYKQMSGTAIIAATHDLWWAERFSSEVVMIKRGQIILNDYTTNVVKSSGSIEAKFMELYDHAL